SFDDCNPFRTQLADSSPSGNTAYRSVGVACAPGVSGLAVAIAAKEDLVYVPDQPSFTFEQGVTVAAWVSPTQLGGTRTIFRKRDKGTSSFALLLDARKFRFVISLGNDVAASLTAPRPATANQLQHVAATYDGTTMLLYVDGAQVASFPIAGAIPPGP